MLNSKNTEARILSLMEKGAKLVYHIRSGGVEMPDFIARIAISHKGKEVTLAVIERWTSDGYPYSASHPAADYIRKHPCIRQAYAGYRGDYDRSWREVYEHENTPVPRWIREQWATPVSQYDESSW